MSRNLQWKNRRLVVDEIIHDGTGMVSVYDICTVTQKLLEKGVDFKVEALKNGIFMITVMRVNVEQKTA